MTAIAPAPQKRCALTFDDGPEPVYTPRILDALARHGIRATFFCLGRQVDMHPELTRRMQAEGHLVANHSWSHPDLTTVPPAEVREEIGRTQKVLAATTGTAPKWFRPPFGAVSQAVREAAVAHQLAIALWTVDSRDWTGHDRPGIVRTVVDRLQHPWEVVLLHTGAHAPHTAEAVDFLIAEARQLGYDLVTLADGPDRG